MGCLTSPQADGPGAGASREHPAPTDHHALPAAQEPGPSERQAVILQRLAAGCGNKEIARELGITERTVKYHLAEIYGRLGAATRAEAVARAGARGWIRLPGG